MRNSIQDFSLANPIYIGATITAWTVSGGVKTATKATLYAGATGTATLRNPQNLDSDGKFQQPVYVDESVIITVSGLSIGDHDTGIINSVLAADSVAEVLTDLAATTAGKGTDMIGFNGGLTGEVDTVVSDTVRTIVSVQRFGAVGDGVTSDTAAIALANASGAMRIYFPCADGEEYVLDANVAIPRGVKWMGDSIDQGGILVKTSLADIVYITMTGYTGIQDLDIHGDDATSGTLVEATGGTYTFTGHLRYSNVRFSTAKVGTKINSIFDITFDECEWLACKKGVDASPLTNGGDNGYINLVKFFGGYFASNVDYDFYANPAVRISNLSFDGTDFDPGPGTAKIYLYTAQPVSFRNTYFEGNNTIPAILSDISVISMEDCYLNGTGGVKANAATAAQLYMRRVRTGSATDIIDYPSSNHVVRLLDVTLPAASNVFSATNQTSRYWDNATVNGTLYEVRRASSNTHVPVLSGAGTAGTPTYSNQTFRQTVIGNQCFFSGRVSITAIGGMVGALRISLPFTSNNTANTFYVCGLSTTGVTPSAGKTYFYGRIAANSAQMELFQDGNAAGATAILDTNIAAATSFFFSGCCEIA